MIRNAISRLIDGHDLTAEEAQAALEQIMAGEASDAQIGAFLIALRMKGETAEEIAGLARAMRANCTRVPTTRANIVDTCGTGGDALDTFNISTAAAFIAAGAGVPVAKHGNRAVSSRCGSADVLNELGVDLAMPPDAVGRCIDEVGVGFLFAPALHPAMKHAIGPRREIGVRTVFNCLGPMTNPAGAQRQLIGVYAPELTELVAHALRDLGSTHAMVVHGTDGLDEISTIGPTQITELRDGQVRTRILDASELGVPKANPEDLAGADAAESARMLLGLLDGEPGPRRDIAVLNAGAAIVVGGLAGDLAEGMEMAAEAIDSGAARQRLDALTEFSQSRRAS